MTPLVSARLDHLVFATPSLAASVAELEQRFGVEFLAGGAHPAWGTRNAVLPLGAGTYLEVIGPDPSSGTSTTPRIFGLDALAAGALVTWAAKGRDLPRLAARARAHGIDLGAVADGSRRRPDGVELTWTLTDPFAARAGGIVPFFIDWKDSPHPSLAAAPRVRLVSLAAEHPHATGVAGDLHALDLDLPVRQGAAARLTASFDTPRGRVTL